MNLFDIIQQDSLAVFHNVNELGQIATFKAGGENPGFSLVVTFGDPDENVAAFNGGQSVDRTAKIFAPRSLIRAGILAIELAERDPVRGDIIVMATGADAGTWIVQDINPDAGDGMQMQCRYDRERIYGAESAVQVR